MEQRGPAAMLLHVSILLEHPPGQLGHELEPPAMRRHLCVLPRRNWGVWGLHPHCSAWFLLSPLLGRHDFKPRTILGFILQCAALSCGNDRSCSQSRLDPVISRVSSNQSESVIHSPVPKQTVGAELKM